MMLQPSPTRVSTAAATGVIVLGHVVHDGQLGVGVQAQLLHGGGDAVVVGVGIARRVVPAVDIDGAHLEVGVGAVRLTALLPGRAGAAGALLCPLLPAWPLPQAARAKPHGGQHKGQKSFLHVFDYPPLNSFAVRSAIYH